jgi:hypothetical protein
MALYTASRVLYLAPEASYAQSPRPADSAYVAMPVTDCGAMDRRTMLDTARLTGRAGPTRKIVGPGQGETSLAGHLVGLSAQGVNGDAPPATDWLDLLMTGLGIPAARDGEAITVAATGGGGGATEVTPVAYAQGDLLPLVDAAGAMRWAYARSLNGADLVLGSESIAAPVRAAPSRQLYDADLADLPTLAGAFQRFENGVPQIEAALPGCRLSAFSIEASAGQLATWTATMQSDDYDASDSFAFTVAANGDPATTDTDPMRLVAVYIDGVEVPCSSVSVGTSITAPVRGATSRDSGRSDHYLADLQPTVTITPRYEAQWEALKRSGTPVEVIVAWRAGDTGSAALRQLALCLPQAQLTGHDPTDAGGLVESTLPFEAIQQGGQRRWLMARS